MGIEKIFQGVKNKIKTPIKFSKKAALTTLLATKLLFGIPAWQGYIHPSYDSVPAGGSLGKAFLVRNPPGAADTLLFTVDAFGRYMGVGLAFSPPAQVGDTIHIYAYKDTLNHRYETRTKIALTNLTIPIFDIHLHESPDSEFDLNVYDISDTNPSTQALDLRSITRHANNPNVAETTLIDTLNTGIYPHLHLFDYFQNTGPQPASLGDTMLIRFEKTRNDTIWHYDTFAVIGENTFDNAVLVADHIFFPKDISTGIAEHEQKTPKTQMQVMPTILKGNNKISIVGLDGKLDVYNSLGQQLDEYKVYGTATLDFSKYSSGVYFLKPKEQELPSVKIIKPK